MISLISTILNAVLSFILHIFKFIFSMLTWFLGKIWSLLKLFFCFLPVTSIVFTLLFLADIYLLLAGIPDITYLSGVKGLLSEDIQISGKLFNDLKIWWTLTLYPYRGSLIFVLLIILSLIMLLPVAFVFLSISVVLSFGQLLFYAAAFDIVLYLLRAIFHKSFVAQFRDRYYMVFPEKGKRHYEKNYEKWLRKHHRQFEDMGEEESARNKVDEFYGDDEDDDYEDYDDEYGDSYNDDYDDDGEDFYESDDYDALEDKRHRRFKPRRSHYYEDNDDEEYYDDYNDEDEDYESEDSDSEASERLSSFNFFAGCNSKESADKKYKSLVKIYHPDNMDGDTAALQEINIQYAQAKKRFS